MAETGKAPAGLGTVEAVSFALLGLLLALTFTGAASRFDAKRALIVDEANAIGTAWLRLDLLAQEPRSKLREGFRKYLDARLGVYQTLSDPRRAQAVSERVTALQTEIWVDAIGATRDAGTTAVILLPAINSMFDIATTRNEARRTHPPAVIYGLLGIISLLCALLAGYEMGGSAVRSWIHTLAFALILAFTVYLILDLEYPRFGLIRLEHFDQVLVDLRNSMN